MQGVRHACFSHLYILLHKVLHRKSFSSSIMTKNKYRLHTENPSGMQSDSLWILPPSFPPRTSVVPHSVLLRSSMPAMERRRSVGNTYKAGKKTCLSPSRQAILLIIAKKWRFVAELCVSLHTIMLGMMLYQLGLTGFDSGQKWYVSMQWVGNYHLNISYQKIIWQRKLCSRCLIEVQ